MNNKRNKAIFLDRDGVIIEERGEYNYKPGHINFNEGIIEFASYARSNGFKLIIITNQGGIAKKLYTREHVREIHQIILDFFHSFHLKIDDIYYCPHHDSVENCICRKPETLLFEKAISKHQIDVSRSYYFGDQERDEIAGNRIGLKTVRILPNENLMQFRNIIQIQ